MVNLTGFYWIQIDALFLLKKIHVSHWSFHLDEGTNKYSLRNTLQNPKLLSKTLLCKTQCEHNLQAGWESASREFYANAGFGKIQGICKVLAQEMVEAQKNLSAIALEGLEYANTETASCPVKPDFHTTPYLCHTHAQDSAREMLASSQPSCEEASVGTITKKEECQRY